MDSNPLQSEAGAGTFGGGHGTGGTGGANGGLSSFLAKVLNI